MNSDPTSPFRLDLDAALRRAWIENNEVTPAPRGRWSRWDLIEDKREREAAKYDHSHPFWTPGTHARVEFWENDRGDLACMTLHVYALDEEKDRAQWAEWLRPLTEKHHLTVHVHASICSWRYPGATLLIEVWSPYA
jgi:hypothetical protein